MDVVVGNICVYLDTHKENDGSFDEWWKNAPEPVRVHIAPVVVKRVNEEILVWIKEAAERFKKYVDEGVTGLIREIAEFGLAEFEKRKKELIN